MEKSHTNATNVSLHPPRQAIWGVIPLGEAKCLTPEADDDHDDDDDEDDDGDDGIIDNLSVVQLYF